MAKFTGLLIVYNCEFESFEELEEITNDFMDEINEEVSQATGETPNQRFKKNKSIVVHVVVGKWVLNILGKII